MSTVWRKDIIVNNRIDNGYRLFYRYADYQKDEGVSVAGCLDDDVTATPANKHTSDRPKKQAERNAL